MKNLNEYVDVVCENISSKLKIIDGIEYHYELSSLIDNTKKLSSEEIDKVLEKLLNKYLELLKLIYTKEKFSSISRKVDDITDFFTKDNDSTMVSDGDLIADDLLCKLINDNGRSLKLPIKLEYLKEYCITSLVKKSSVNNEIIWIILRLATIYYCLNDNNIQNSSKLSSN